MNDEIRNKILDNNNNPYHKKTITDDSYKVSNSRNLSCVDNINLFVKIEDNTIKDIYFDGEACAITVSATSIMIKLLIGKTIDEVKEIITEYENMINEKHYNDKLLEDAGIYNYVIATPSRKTCALLPYEALKKSIDDYEDNI